MWIPAFSLILVLAVAFAFFLRHRGVRTAYIWLGITVLCLLLWLLLIIIPVEEISPFEIQDWFRIGENTIRLSFIFHRLNWPVIFTIISFNLAFFLTAVVRLDIRSDLMFWLIQLVLTIIAMLAFSAANLWTLLIIWTALDILGFIYLYQMSKSAYTIQVFRPMIVKFIGSLVLVWVISTLAPIETSSPVQGLSQRVGFPLFIAAFFHSGALPVPTYKEKYRSESDRIIQTAFKTINFAASFSIIPMLAVPQLPMLVSLGLKVITAVIIFVACITWMQDQSVEGFHHLLLSIAGILLLVFINGFNHIFSYLLVFPLFSVLWLSIFTHRNKGLLVFFALFLLLISGLPFSLISFGTRGFLVQGIALDNLLLLVPFACILAGLTRRGVRPSREFLDLEAWFQVVYLAGLVVFLLSQIFIVINSFTTLSQETTAWEFALGTNLLALILFFITYRNRKKERKISDQLDAFASGLYPILTMQWLFRATASIRDKIRKIIMALSLLLEGEGGVLWALVILILMISLINPR